MKYFAFSQLDSEGRIISLSSGEEGSAGSLSVAEVAGGADDPDLVLTLQDAAEAVTAAEEADKEPGEGMLNMEGIKIEKLEGNPPTLTPTNNSSLPSVTRKELESTSTKTLVLASSLSSTYSSILSLSSSSSTYYSWRAQAARPWCWPHQFSPPRPESQI